MINIAEQYRSYFEFMKYGDGYDIKLHGIQTAYTVLGYMTKEGVDRNSIQYGYNCVNTEAMTRVFQEEHDLRVTGILDINTWNLVFDELLIKCNCIVAQTGERQVSLFDVDAFLEEKNASSNSMGNQNGTNEFTDKDSEGTSQDIVWPGYNGEQSFFSDSGVSFDDYASSTINGNVSFDDFVTSMINSGASFSDEEKEYLTNGVKTPEWDKDYIVNGNEVFDELMYNYIVNGGELFGSMNYSYNIDGEETWHNDMVTPSEITGSDKDYDFIYNLFSNSIYSGAMNDGPLWSSMSDSTTISSYKHSYEESTNAPFFDPSNINTLRKSKFDISIVYGAKAEKSRKIVEVTPISVTQEINASGEPIYDIYEFIAKDIVESK